MKFGRIQAVWLAFGMVAAANAQWPTQFNGPSNTEDRVAGMAMDASGNVFVAGTSGDGNNANIAIVRYTPAGVEDCWTLYEGPAAKGDVASAIQVDAAGNVYVCGASAGLVNDDYLILKYDNGLNPLWAKTWNGPANSHDFAVGLAVDNIGNVYVTGYTQQAGINRDYATVKYNSAGVKQWQKIFYGPGTGVDEPRAIKLDQSGSVIVTGTSDGGASWADYATVKYSPSGAKLWAKRFNGTGNSDDKAMALAIDSHENIIVTGESVGANGGVQYATVKYSAAGSQMWQKRWGPNTFVSSPRAMAVDSSGNIYVTGTSGSDIELMDYATIKYDQTGVLQWARKYTAHLISGGSNDGATAMVLDPAGFLYVTGYAQGDGTNFDYNYATVKYTTSGTKVWAKRYGTTGDDMAVAIGLSSLGGVIVAGDLWGGSQMYNFGMVRYAP
jgi:uncharacterized delta-60 repeat protein